MRRAGHCLVLVTLGALVSSCGPLNSNELRQEVSGVHSAAAEGGLLAQGAAQDRTRSTFTRVQAKELSSSVSAGAEKLADADPAASLKEPKIEAIRLALAVSAALDDLALRPGDEPNAATVEKTLAGLAERTQRLEDSL